MIRALTQTPAKLILPHGSGAGGGGGNNLAALAAKAEAILFTGDTARKADLRSRRATQADWPWVDEATWEQVVNHQIMNGKWEAWDTDGLTKNPPPKSLDVMPKITSNHKNGGWSDDGKVSLSVSVANASDPSKVRIHVAEDRLEATTKDPVLDKAKWQEFETGATRVAFLAVDVEGKQPSGKSRLHALDPHVVVDDTGRERGEPVRLSVFPSGLDMRYTLDGSKPSEGGKVYSGPFAVGGDAAQLLVAVRLPTGEWFQKSFSLSQIDSHGQRVIDKAKPAAWRSPLPFSDRRATFRVLEWMKNNPGTIMENPDVFILSSDQKKEFHVRMGGYQLNGEQLLSLLGALPKDIFTDSCGIQLEPQAIHFANGHALEAFSQELGQAIDYMNVEQ